MNYNYSLLRAFGLLGLKFASQSGEKYILNINAFIIMTVIFSIFGYLLGSLNFAIIISKLKYHDDIRNHGSKNAGMTNMVRTYGTAAGAFTLVGDLLKAVVTVLLTRFLAGEASAYVAGFFCILGHSFPCWYRFKGGKGVAVSAAMILCLEPIVFLVLLVVFVIVVAVTRYISLGSIMCVLMYPLILRAFYPYTHPDGALLYPIITICSILTAMLVLFLHRSNMQRLLNHTENKFSLKKGKKKENNDN